jgi:hypothetical protein
MTTSVEATVHLHLGRALAANPAGIGLVALVLFLLVRRPASLRFSPAILAVVLAGMWAFELFRFRVL